MDNNNNIYPPSVSVFNPGYISKKNGKAVLQCKPYKTATLVEVWDYIRGQRAKRATDELRAETDKERQDQLKMLSLKHCTPFGTFSHRDKLGLMERSGMMVIDIDDIKDSDELERLKNLLLADTHYETDLLFISPRGHGLKWFIHVGDMGGMELKDYFRRVSRYLQFQYGIIADETGKDIPRACYLSHDPDCYINPKYIQTHI